VKVVSFQYQASGATAGINAAEFYTCGVCGACIVEMHRRDHSRNTHTAWHQAIAAGEVEG
jgi:hypothetical protein